MCLFFQSKRGTFAKKYRDCGKLLMDRVLGKSYILMKIYNLLR